MISGLRVKPKFILHHFFFSADGDMYVWGWNESGQLGLPNGKEADASKDVSASESARTDCSEEICRKRPRMCSDSDVCALCKASVVFVLCYCFQALKIK